MKKTRDSAHSGRSWLGVNAVHGAAPVLTRLTEYTPHAVEVDGLVFREGLNAVGIRGGVAGNIIPDECVVTVNYRFAPDRDVAAADIAAGNSAAGNSAARGAACPRATYLLTACRRATYPRADGPVASRRRPDSMGLLIPVALTHQP
ncbi:MAG: peptidase dimerization domain-containing protein [Spirochaetaceae bacterium]